MKKQEIKEWIEDIINTFERMRVEEDTPYYEGWRSCTDEVLRELKYLNEKIPKEKEDVKIKLFKCDKCKIMKEEHLMHKLETLNYTFDMCIDCATEIEDNLRKIALSSKNVQIANSGGRNERI